MQHAEALAEYLNRFPEVTWDRWTGWYAYPEEEAGVSSAAAYGWIERTDKYKDFLVLHFFATQDDGIYDVSYVTSSDRYSARFGERLGSETHLDCRRVEDDLPEVEKRVVLTNSTRLRCD